MSKGISATESRSAFWQGCCVEASDGRKPVATAASAKRMIALRAVPSPSGCHRRPGKLRRLEDLVEVEEEADVPFGFPDAEDVVGVDLGSQGMISRTLRFSMPYSS